LLIIVVVNDVTTLQALALQCVAEPSTDATSTIAMGTHRRGGVNRLMSQVVLAVASATGLKERVAEYLMADSDDAAAATPLARTEVRGENSAEGSAGAGVRAGAKAGAVGSFYQLTDINSLISAKIGCLDAACTAATCLVVVSDSPAMVPTCVPKHILIPPIHLDLNVSARCSLPFCLQLCFSCSKGLTATSMQQVHRSINKKPNACLIQ
jgi:hypothetical protein